MNHEDDIFAEALELPPSERRAFLDRVCGHDPILRARIEALLLGHKAAESFLEQPLTTWPVPAAEEKAGTRIGPYTLLRRIGEGGCGVVWLAEQTSPLRRKVALKVIKLGMDTQAIIARFAAERQALALMSHPDIARVYDAGATDAGRPFFVMEYVEGVPITRFCDEHSLAMDARLELFSRVCLALQHAHQKGIIHRDLKPSNILVALRDGVPAPKVIDFGIAKATAGRLTDVTLHTELGQFLGTPAYMSPEQAEQRELDLDTRSDVYSLGVLLYELLTGRPPYDPKDLVRAGLLEIRRIIREVDPPRPSTLISTLAEADRATVARLRGAAPPRLSAALRGDLDWIVMRCLEKDRNRRYGTAAALAEDVHRHLRQEPVEARPPQALYRLQKLIARNRLACASAAAVAVVLVAGTVVSTLQAVRAARAERIAAAERDTARTAQRAEAVARADAQRRQEQAEDLLTFMLGDFRTELQKIGKLELLDRISGQAMKYFEDLDLRDVTDTALARQAKALTQLGEVRLDQGRFVEAEQAFAAAYTRTAKLVARHPRDGDMLFERGQAEFWIGFAARRRGDADRQREWLVRYRDTAVALAKLEGPTSRAVQESIHGYHNLAVLDLERDDPTSARTGFLACRANWETALAARPGDPQLLFGLADVNSWLGTTAERDGRYAEAARHFEAMAGIYAKLAQLDPINARWRFEQARSLTFIGIILAISGRRADSTAKFDEAAALFKEVVAQAPDNKNWLSVGLRLQLQRASLRLRPAKAALPEVVAARGELLALADADPGPVSFARLAIMALTLEGGLLLEESRLPEAAATMAHAHRLTDALLKKDPTDVWTRNVAAHAFITEGQVEAAQGGGTAVSCWQQALAVIGNVEHSNDWRLLEPAAVANLLARQADAATPLIAKLKTFGYHPADPHNAAMLGLAE